MKILVIQQKMIGDVLTSSILFEALRERYPEAQLDYLINSHTLPVVANNPNIDNFVVFTKEIESSKNNLFKFCKSIKQEHYDVVIDVYSKLSSNIITIFSGAKTKISYYKPYSAFVYNHNVKRLNATDVKSELAIVNRFQLLKPLGIDAIKTQPKIYLTSDEIDKAKQLLKTHNINLSRSLVMISVLGSGDLKTYPFPFMAQVIDIIVSQTQAQILFNYIPNQETQAKEIFNLCKPKTQEHIVFDLFGKDLREFLALTYHCDALIGNEGGAINMAKALHIKTFSIFSPWIDKATWSLFEDETMNASVHLKDYKPELYDTKVEKEMKKSTFQLYQQFNPSLFEEKLNVFLHQITNN